MKRVLMVSYTYPPMSTPGALRSSKFAKYLPRHGWEPVVVTPRDGYARAVGLEGSELPGVTVVRTADVGALKRAAARVGPPAAARGAARGRPGLGPLVARLLFPDRDAPWYPFALAAALRVVRQGGVHALYSTSPSVTNHMVALHVAMLTGLPWIADYRDPWTITHLYKPLPMRRRLDAALDRAIHRRANRVLLVSEYYRDRVAEAYPEVADRVTVLRNGFDPDDFAGLPDPPSGGPFVLTYSGSFYGGGREPGGLFAAMAALAAEGVLTPERFRLDLVGEPEAEIARLAREHGVEALVSHVGRIPYRENLARLAASSALLVITETDLRARGELTTKLYEYFGVGRPVLALTPPEFELAGVVAQAGAGTCIHPRDSGAIAEWLRRAVHAPPAASAPPAGLEGFTRAAGAARLAALLDEVSAPAGAASPARTGGGR